MTLMRLSFAVYFGDMGTLFLNLNELRKAMFLGLRFDLMPLAYVNVLPFILLNVGYLFPQKSLFHVLRFSIIGILLTGYLTMGWIYVCDYGFYSYFQEHLNILFFGLFEDDTKALLISISKNYNLFFWLSFILSLHYLLFKAIKFLFSSFDFDLRNNYSRFNVFFVFIVGIISLALMARGNFSRLPLSIEDSYLGDNEFLNEISLNGFLTLNRAIKIRKNFGKDSFNYLEGNGFKHWIDAYRAYTGKEPDHQNILIALKEKTKINPFLKKQPPHVILVVMESMGTYWNKFNSEEFQILGDLKNHFDNGILFNHFLPSENGTIGSIVSIGTSQVIRPGARFLSESEFMKTTLASAGNRPFKESGYETHFVYGGKLGWRNLGKYLSIQGYDKLWGADEIKEAMPELKHISERDLGNEWGIFDEYLYLFIEEHLRTATKPQLFFVLTTSNHPPFEFPSTYIPKPIKLTPQLLSQLTVDESMSMKRFLGLQYANQKIGEFLTRIKTSAIRENTILALTGDHSFWIAKGVGMDQEFNRYAVPFFLSIPTKYIPSQIDTNKFGSHEDIFPTLINLSLSDQTYIKLGEDIFSEESSAINSSGLMANKDGAFHHNKFWHWINFDKLILGPASESTQLRALKNKGLGLVGLTDLYLKNEKMRKRPVLKSGRP